MIQNPTILEKLRKKTSQDTVMYNFICKIMNNEAEGKQYSKYYKNAILESIKQRKKEEGK